MIQLTYMKRNVIFLSLCFRMWKLRRGHLLWSLQSPKLSSVFTLYTVPNSVALKHSYSCIIIYLYILVHIQIHCIVVLYTNMQFHWHTLPNQILARTTTDITRYYYCFLFRVKACQVSPPQVNLCVIVKYSTKCKKLGGIATTSWQSAIAGELTH